MPQPYIVCPACGRVSHNPHDIEHRYCGACHAFHDDMPFLPSYCFDCAVYLMGGATQHKPGCSVLAVIEEAKRAAPDR
jgi:hypothetical protein